MGWWSAFWQGFAINMTNPKTLLFFAAIFAGYVGPGTPAWVRAAAVAICVATCLGWQVAMAWLFSTPPRGRDLRPRPASDRPHGRRADGRLWPAPPLGLRMRRC